jgi:hypothetical protein
MSGATRRLSGLSVAAAIATTGIISLSATETSQQAAAPPPQQALKGVAIRGCLVGSKLTHIDQDDSAPTLPNPLTVSSIRVIRSQVKALSGHQVEVIGSLRNIPGMETGFLVAESDKGRLYIGGGDPRLGEDLRAAPVGPPTVHAHTIRDLAPTCTASQPK